MKRSAFFVLVAVAMLYGMAANAQSSDQTANKKPLRMFADRNGDLFWMDTHSFVANADGTAGVTVYFVEGGYPSERQQLTSACCGQTVVTRAPEGKPTYFQFACNGSYTYTINRSSPLYAASLSIAYNMAQFACARASCKREGRVCSE